MGYNKYYNNNIRPYQKNEQIRWFRVDGRPICVKKCSLTTVHLVEVGIQDVQGFPLLAQPAPTRTTPWLVNLHLPATSPHANGTRHLSH